MTRGLQLSRAEGRLIAYLKKAVPLPIRPTHAPSNGPGMGAGRRARSTNTLLFTGLYLNPVCDDNQKWNQPPQFWEEAR